MKDPNLSPDKSVKTIIMNEFFNIKLKLVHSNELNCKIYYFLFLFIN